MTRRVRLEIEIPDDEMPAALRLWRHRSNANGMTTEDVKVLSMEPVEPVRTTRLILRTQVPLGQLRELEGWAVQVIPITYPNDAFDAEVIECVLVEDYPT